MNYELKDTISAWNREVEAEAIELIEGGMAPYDAVDKARSIVAARRREAKLRRAASDEPKLSDFADHANTRIYSPESPEEK